MAAVYDWKAEADAVFGVISVRAFLIAAACYVPFVLLLQRAFKARKPVDTPVLLNGWNAFVALASAYAAVYVVGDLVFSWPAICDPALYSQHVSSRWVLIFNLTKALEWVDTLFLVLKKREVSRSRCRFFADGTIAAQVRDARSFACAHMTILHKPGFLHLFHHLVTMLYCLHATLFSFRADASGIYFCGMNLVVHALMYGYWAVLPRASFLRRFGFAITLLQLSQMVVGVGLTLAVTFSCPRSWSSNWHGCVFALGMYAVYFYLFLLLVIEKLCPANKLHQKSN